MRCTWVLFGIIIFLACSCAMKQVHMRAYRPALITVPPDVKNVLILNRSAPADEGKKIAGAILSADLPGDRQAAVQAAMNGIQEQLLSTPRYNILLAEEVYAGSNISAAFPKPLAWQEIEMLCKKYQADVIIALEIFSTKFLITNGKRMATKVIELGGTEQKISVPEFYVNGVATIDIGFRLYDPVPRKIVDKHVFAHKNGWEGAGSSPTDAMGVLISKNEAVRQASFDAGYSYGTRISPTPITITRDFYKGPKKNAAITRGTRLADTGQWQEALETWRSGAERASKRKIAGRLCYNTAIVYEVFGEFDKAIDWASRAYVDYGNKKGLEYERDLRYRVRQENVLSEQME